MKKRIIFFIFFTLCLVVIFLSIFTEVCKNRRNVKVAIYQYGEFQSIDEVGSVKGYNIEYLKEIEKYSNLKFEYVAVDNFVEAEKALESGEADIICPVEYNELTKNLFEFSDNLVAYKYGGVYTLKDREDVGHSNSKNYKAFKYGCIKNSTTFSNFLEHQKNVNKFEPIVIEFNTTEEMIKALKRKEIDVMLSDVKVYEEDLVLEHKTNPSAIYYGSKKGNRAVLEEMDTAMEKISLYKGDLEKKLFDKYFINLEEVREDVKYRDYLDSLPTLNVGYRLSDAPISYLNEDGEFSGIVRRMLDNISKKLGVKFNYVLIEEDKLTREYLIENKINIISNYVYGNYDENMTYLKRSTPYLQSSSVLVSRGDIKSLDVKNKKIGVGSNVKIYIRELERLEPSNEYVVYESINDAYNDLVRKELDGLIVNNYIANIYSSRAKYEWLDTFPLEEVDNSLCMGVITFSNVDYLENNLLKDERFIESLNSVIRGFDAVDVNNIVLSEMTKLKFDYFFLYIIYTYRYGLAIFILFILTILSAIVILSEILRHQKNDLKSKNELLSKSIEEIEKANRAKSDFLSRISHEIRTPLNSILGTTEIIRQSKPEKELMANVETISDSSKFLLSIINDILDMSKIESGKFEINPVWDYPGTILFDCAEIMKPLIEKKHIEFIYPKPLFGSEFEYYIDKMRVMQVIMNVLNNAYKFTPQNGKIEIKVENEAILNGKNISIDKITIKDNGCGISKEYLEHIFEPFSQEGEGVYTETAIGSGLGLAIVKNIMDAMNGEIIIKSEKGVGTEVMLTFRHRYRYCEKKDRKEEVIDFNRLKGKRVLLVEDNSINYYIVKQLLENKEMIVEGAENGLEAVKMVEKAAFNYYDIILMDIRMPVMDGIEATNIIRKMDREDSKYIPIVAFSADVFSENEKRSKLVGIDEYLIKPVEPEIMYKIILRMIEKKES